MKIKKFIEGSSETTREITIQNTDLLISKGKQVKVKGDKKVSLDSKISLVGKKSPQQNFYNWWIGFLEGDGSFFIRSNNTLGFEISQKTADAQVLYYIKTNLGFGQVNHNSKVSQSRFILPSRKSSYLNLINLLKIEDLRLIKRQIQYKLWIKKAELLTNSHLIKDTPLTPKLPNLEDSWLSGFIDAEGCFRISYDKAADKYRLIFQITQDEVEILENIKLLFGSRHKGSIIKDRNTNLLMISGEKARELIISYLNLFPLNTQKRVAFIKWEKCHRLLLSLKMKDLTPELKEKTLDQIKFLKESINKYS